MIENQEKQPFAQKGQKKFKWTEEIMTAMRLRYPEEGQAMADEFGVSRDKLKQKAFAMGLKVAIKNKNQKIVRLQNNKSVDWKYFETWSPNMAYLLGYIWADGCVSSDGTTVYLSCTEKDREILENIKSELKVVKPIRSQPGFTSYMKVEKGDGKTVTKPYVALDLGSRLLVESLNRKGIHPRKSFNDYPMTEVPDEYLGHFARGNMDGDGFVGKTTTIREVGFLGSYKFIDTLASKVAIAIGIDKPSVRRLTKEPEKHLTEFRIGDGGDRWHPKGNLRKLFDFLYPQGKYLYLKRKRKLFEDLLSVENVNGRLVQVNQKVNTTNEYELLRV